MELWRQWWSMTWQLRPACSRLRRFLWFATCVAGMTVRADLLGVTDQPWGAWLGPVVLFVKVFLLLYGIIWVRATLPRIRYDQLMALGWKIMLPLALFNVFLTAVIILAFPGWFK